MATMIAETSFIISSPDPLHLLKNEAIDRLASIVNDLPKYKKNLENLIDNFKIDDTLWLINIMDRDQDFKTSVYRARYIEYFDEIEELIHKYLY